MGNIFILNLSQNFFSHLQNTNSLLFLSSKVNDVLGLEIWKNSFESKSCQQIAAIYLQLCDWEAIEREKKNKSNMLVKKYSNWMLKF